MSTTNLAGRLADRASDWLNPILVKEARQALKSRQFIATFLLLLGVSWLASVLCVLALTGDGSATTGRDLFTYYYYVLAVAIFVVVPFTAFRSLQTERDQHTYEVLSVTTLNPRQILLGKLGSALVQMFIYYSALTPFIAFTYLLRGIDFPTIAYILAIGFLGSVVISLLALTLSTFASQRQWQVMLTLMVLGALVAAMFCFCAATTSWVSSPLPFQDRSFWFGNAAFLTMALGYSMLVEQIAVAQLTFDADNRSTGVRIVTSVLYGLWLVVPVAAYAWGGGSRVYEDNVLVICAIQLGVIGLFLVTEPDTLSRRLQRKLHRMKARRLPALFYYPGGSRGLWYVLAHLLLPLGVLYVVMQSFPGSSAWSTFERGVMLAMYVIVYLGWSAAMARWGRKLWSEFRPAHARVIAWALAVVLMLVPNVLELTDVLKWARPWLLALNPFEMDNVKRGNAFYLLLAGCAGAIIVNLPAMFHTATETLRGETAAAAAAPPQVIPAVTVAASSAKASS